ncbi:MAG: hypothetical protein ACYSRR_04450 [Planctomycetota bacterium]
MLKKIAILVLAVTLLTTTQSFAQPQQPQSEPQETLKPAKLPCKKAAQPGRKHAQLGFGQLLNKLDKAYQQGDDEKVGRIIQKLKKAKARMRQGQVPGGRRPCGFQNRPFQPKKGTGFGQGMRKRQFRRGCPSCGCCPLYGRGGRGSGQGRLYGGQGRGRRGQGAFQRPGLGRMGPGMMKRHGMHRPWRGARGFRGGFRRGGGFGCGDGFKRGGGRGLRRRQCPLLELDSQEDFDW